MICWGTFGVENILVWLNKIKFKKRKLQIIHEEKHINLSNTGLKSLCVGFSQASPSILNSSWSQCVSTSDINIILFLLYILEFSNSIQFAVCN